MNTLVKREAMVALNQLSEMVAGAEGELRKLDPKHKLLRGSDDIDNHLAKWNDGRKPVGDLEFVKALEKYQADLQKTIQTLTT
jgi:hypothetical protein